MRLAAGLLLALAASAALNASFYVQHEAASGMPPLRLRHPVRSLRLLFTDLKWFVGWLAGWVGWGLYILALRFAPLSLSQAVVAGGVGLIALLARYRAKVVPSPLEKVGIRACLVGLALVAASLGASAPRAALGDWRPIALWVGACVLAAGMATAVPSRYLASGAGLGAAAGLLYAGGDIATKGAVSSAGLGFVPVLLACHLVGFVCLQLAFQRGSALSTAGLSSLLNNTVPIAAGLVAFHEGVPANLFGALRIVGFVAVVLGASLIARKQAPTVLREGSRPAACDADAGDLPETDRL